MLCVCRQTFCALGKISSPWMWRKGSSLGCHQAQLPSAASGQIGRVLSKQPHSFAAFQKISAVRSGSALRTCVCPAFRSRYFLCILHFTERLRCLKGAATDFEAHSHLFGVLNKSISFSLSISSTIYVFDVCFHFPTILLCCASA